MSFSAKGMLHAPAARRPPPAAAGVALILFISGDDGSPRIPESYADEGGGGVATRPSESGVEQPAAGLRPDQVVGGVAADILWPGVNNYYQTYDNLRFQVAIDAPDGETGITIGAFNGGSLTGSQFVSLSGGSSTGTFHSRVKWPHQNGVKYDVLFKYGNGGGTWYDCAGADPSDTQQYLHTNVKVHRIHVHNTNSLPDPGGYTTTWTDTDVDSVSDSTGTSTPGSASNTLDGIFGQCGPLAANGIDKTQWRRHATTNTISIPSNCSDLTSEFATCGGCSTACSAVQNCLTAMMDAAGQVLTIDAHVYVIGALGCQSGGIIAGALTTTIGSRKLIIIDDMFDPSAEPALSTELISHELGHGMELEHTDEPSDNCDDDDNMYIKNLMCNDLGRLLTDFQCDRARSMTPYIDRN